MPYQTLNSRRKSLRKKTNYGISIETATYVVAAKEGIDVHKLLTKEGKQKELEDFKTACATYDFDNHEMKRKSKPVQTPIDTNGNGATQNNKQSKIIEKIIIVGKKYGIENIDQNWIDSIAILNFIETVSTKFLMEHDYTEDQVKSMKWDVKLTQLENKIGEEARLKGVGVRSSVTSFFKSYRQVRNDQDHIAHLPTSHVTKGELSLLQKNLDIFIKTVFVEHRQYCLK